MTVVRKFSSLRICLVALILGVPVPVVACFWIDGTTLAGERTRLDGFQVHQFSNIEARIRGEVPAFDSKRENLLAVPDAPRDLSEWQRGGGTAEADPKVAEERAAVMAILAGDYPGGIGRLEALEAAQPGGYAIAVNLGTAYELAGDNHNALKWISEGLARNPESHFGTEWLHKLILENKIRLEQNPVHLRTNRILPVDEKAVRDNAFSFETGGRAYSIAEITKALAYQLNERVVFVGPPDPVVADLLYSYALMVAASLALEPAIELLDLSARYGFPDEALIASKKQEYATIVKETWPLRWLTDWFSSLGVGWHLFILLTAFVLATAALVYLLHLLLFRIPKALIRWDRKRLAAGGSK
jgi:hypothetical protein